MSTVLTRIYPPLLRVKVLYTRIVLLAKLGVYYFGTYFRWKDNSYSKRYVSSINLAMFLRSTFIYVTCCYEKHWTDWFWFIHLIDVIDCCCSLLYGPFHQSVEYEYVLGVVTRDYSWEFSFSFDIRWMRDSISSSNYLYIYIYIYIYFYIYKYLFLNHVDIKDQYIYTHYE